MPFCLAILGLGVESSARATDPVFADRGFVLRAPPSGFGSTGLNAPTLAFSPEDGLFHMFVEVKLPAEEVPVGCCEAYGIGQATSPDGLSWFLDPLPVILPAKGTPYACGASQPGVVYDRTTWTLFYTTIQGPKGGVCGVNETTGIGQATSTDAVHWDLSPEPVVAGADIGFPTAAIAKTADTGDGYRLHLMWTQVPDFRLATRSLDPKEPLMVEPDPVMSPGIAGEWMASRIFGPSLYCRSDSGENLFGLVFGAKSSGKISSLGTASSQDAVDWFISLDSPLEGADLDLGALNHWDVLPAQGDHAEGDLLLWYSTDDPTSGLKAIGLASSSPTWKSVGSRVCPPIGDSDADTDADTDTDTDADSDTDADTDADSGTRFPDRTDPAYTELPMPCNCASGGRGAVGGVLVGLVSLAWGRRRRVPGSEQS